jgi:hypothetical protein
MPLLGSAVASPHPAKILRVGDKFGRSETPYVCTFVGIRWKNLGFEYVTF